MICVWYLAGERDVMLLQNVQTNWGPPGLLFCGYQDLSHRDSGWGVKLPTHLYVLRKLRINGIKPLLPLYVFMEWTGMTVPLYVFMEWTGMTVPLYVFMEWTGMTVPLYVFMEWTGMTVPLYVFMEWTGMTVSLFLRAPKFFCCLTVHSSCYIYYCIWSNKIAILGTKDVENPPRGQTLQLQQIIRVAATSYLKEQVVTLPALPTEAQLKAMQYRRRFVSVCYSWYYKQCMKSQILSLVCHKCSFETNFECFSNFKFHQYL
jgi:hypothetical protein